MPNKFTTFSALSDKPVIFVDPSSLGYNIQGMSLLNQFRGANKIDAIVEVDARLLPLYERSFTGENIRFVAADASSRIPLPHGGKPQTAEEMEAYYEGNAALIAEKLGIKDYEWSALMRPDIAAPFNAHTLPDNFIAAPSPGYLVADEAQSKEWASVCDAETFPVLLTWNKGFSQHGDAAVQNLDANDVVCLIKELSRTSEIKMQFFNAMHGISKDDLAAVNSQLPAQLHLQMIKDPRTGDDFNLGSELDRYAAFISHCKSLGGIMIGVGNTYQHLWYAVSGKYNTDSIPNQAVILPHGDFPTKATWEAQAREAGSPTITISRPDNFEDSREESVRHIARQTALNLTLS